MPSILCVKPASLYLPKVTLLPTSSLGLTSRCAESGCNPTLPGLPHRPTQKPEPTDHHSALSNPLPCQEGAPCEWQVTLVCRGQKASLSWRGTRRRNGREEEGRRRKWREENHCKSSDLPSTLLLHPLGQLWAEACGFLPSMRLASSLSVGIPSLAFIPAHFPFHRCTP